MLTWSGVTNSSQASGGRDSIVTAVFSRSFNGYKRPVDADGTPRIQTYIVAKGGYAPGLGKDSSIDDAKFDGIVRVLGQYLAKQRYYPAKSGKNADLMVAVHWGKTVTANNTYRNLLDQGLQSFTVDKEDQSGAGSELIQFAQDLRYAEDRGVANLLGYTDEMNYRDTPALYAGAGTAYYDLLADLESERYYIAITAFDFQGMLQQKPKSGLWRTVVSIDARDNRFDERVGSMIAQASHYFGKNSDRLVRQFEYTPRVSLGEFKVLETMDGQPPPKK